MSKRVRGHKQAANSFRQLARLVGTPMGQASRYALQPTLRAARRNAREIRDTGALARSLTLKRANRDRLKPVYHVGPRSDYEGPDGRKPVRYAHLQEWGRAPNADGTGGMDGSLWLTRAYEETADGALNRFRMRFWFLFGRHLNRLRRR